MARVYNQMMSVSVPSSSIFSGTVKATMVATHAIPTGGAYLRIEVKGGTLNTGTITIVGDVDGVSTTENVTFTTDRWTVTENKWDAGTPVITSSGLADETTKPTVMIDCSDAAGNKVEWSTYKKISCNIRAMKALGFQYLIQVKQPGTYAPGMYNVFVKGNPISIVKENSIFTIDKMDGTFVVASQVQQHLQSRTNRVDELNFIAIKRG